MQNVKKIAINNKEIQYSKASFFFYRKVENQLKLVRKTGYDKSKELLFVLEILSEILSHQRKVFLRTD